MQTTYKTLLQTSEGEYKNKGSRFLAFAFPIQTVDEVKAHVDRLRLAHHKARHVCYAYRLGYDGQRMRANDDGEPSGSAGRPILGQIDSAQVVDVLVVVVRYFGGTLLGVPGLIQAYKGAAMLALENATIIEKKIEKTVHLRCEYPYLSEALRIAKQHNACVVAQDLQSDCRITVSVPVANCAAACLAWQETRVITVQKQDTV